MTRTAFQANSATMRRSLLAAVVLTALLPPLARSEEALSPAAQRGVVFVRLYCASCHAIDKVSESPLKVAAPLRTLHLRYPVESLRDSLAVGIITGHPTMAQFQLDPGQVADVIAYLKSLEP